MTRCPLRPTGSTSVSSCVQRLTAAQYPTASGTASGLILVGGYFAYANLWLGKGLAAAASIPGNIVQALFGLIAAVLVYTALNRGRALSHI